MMNHPHTIYISAKCHNMFSMGVMDVNKRHIASYCGYVPSFMPNAGGSEKYVQMEIEIETGQILNWKNPIGDPEFNAILKDASGEVPKTVYISAKCYYMFEMSVVDAKWEEIASYYGYVPSFLQNDGECENYIQMEIDIETGEIFDWENPLGDSEFDEILEFGRRNPTTISISAFSGDSFGMTVRDKNGTLLADYDGDLPSFMPGGGGYADCIEMKINIETGEILGWKNPIGNREFDKMIKGNAGNKVPKVISFSAKCTDGFDMTVMNGDGKEIANYSGYVPSFIPREYGDYVAMKIDIETGRIFNWKNPMGDPEFNAILSGINLEF